MVLSPDDFLIRPDGTYDWSPSRVSSAWRETLVRVKDLLCGGPRYSTIVLLCGVPGAGKSTWLRHHMSPSSLYVDATFTTQASRAPFVSIASSFGKPIDVVFLDTPFEECLRRNSLRSPDRRIPEDKMASMCRSLSSDPPTVSEGFRQVVIVDSTS